MNLAIAFVPLLYGRACSFVFGEKEDIALSVGGVAGIKLIASSGGIIKDCPRRDKGNRGEFSPVEVV